MITLQRIELEGTRFVVLKESEYERLCREANAATDDGDLPPLPKPDKNGNVPALEFGTATIARGLIRDRKSLRLSQQRLAELAGVRQETISRIESGKHLASVGSIDKIDAAIEAERKRQKKRNGKE